MNPDWVLAIVGVFVVVWLVLVVVVSVLASANDYDALYCSQRCRNTANERLRNGRVR